MESPVIHPESPMEQEDVPFPCMGCGEVGEMASNVMIWGAMLTR